MRVILAPHPDDEVIGCASLLRGARVIYITNGDNGREERMEKVAAMFDFEYVPLNFIDGKLNDSLVPMYLALEKWCPRNNALFIPSVFDKHPDHRATAIVGMLMPSFRKVFYRLTSPLPGLLKDKRIVKKDVHKQMKRAYPQEYKRLLADSYPFRNYEEYAEVS